MNRISQDRVPEYILEESGRIALTANQLASLSTSLLALEVELVVLSKELSLLVDTSQRIGSSMRRVRLPLQEEL